MAGYWEVWHLASANLLADFETEAEALALVRELIDQGVAPVDLSMGFDDPAIDINDLELALTGEELARRAEAAGSDPIRRTA
jgi:hypothetical protein